MATTYTAPHISHHMSDVALRTTPLYPVWQFSFDTVQLCLIVQSIHVSTTIPANRESFPYVYLGSFPRRFQQTKHVDSSTAIEIARKVNKHLAVNFDVLHNLSEHVLCGYLMTQFAEYGLWIEVLDWIEAMESSTPGSPLPRKPRNRTRSSRQKHGIEKQVEYRELRTLMGRPVEPLKQRKVGKCSQVYPSIRTEPLTAKEMSDKVLGQIQQDDDTMEAYCKKMLQNLDDDMGPEARLAYSACGLEQPLDT